MFKFFRTIRKKLIEENNVRKFILYAMGEILLVVIGILIALQVNNLNEQRKAHKFEEEILYLIDQNLQRDSLRLAEVLSETEQAIELTDRLVEQVALENYDNNLNYWMGKIIAFQRFKSQSSAFEVLKARGIESISNKDLQLALIAYYDENLFEVYQSLEDVENSFNADWIPVIKQDFLDFKWKDYHTPINSKVFFENQSTIVLFKMFQDNREAGIDELENALQQLSKIRHLIKIQLQ